LSHAWCLGFMPGLLMPAAMPAALMLLLQGLLHVPTAQAGAAVCALPLAAAVAGNSSSSKGGGEVLPGVANALQSPLPSLVVAAAAEAAGADTTLPAAAAGSAALKV
jgi:hypothetical protein